MNYIYFILQKNIILLKISKYYFKNKKEGLKFYLEKLNEEYKKLPISTSEGTIIERDANYESDKKGIYKKYV